MYNLSSGLKTKQGFFFRKEKEMEDLRIERLKRKVLVWRWSFITALTITGFWTLWYFINGQVPVVTDIKMTEEWILKLPFGISRWWDILIGPIWSIIIISLFANQRVRKDKDLIFFLVAGLGFGLVAGLSFGLGFGLVFGLSFGLIFGLGFGLGFVLRYLLQKNFGKHLETG